MRILITGGTGFLGRHLGRALETAGHSVTAFGSRDCDLRQPGSLACFDAFRFDQIYHLAAWTQAGEFCLHHPGEQWIINQKINTNVLAWWQDRQPQAKLIAMGSSCCYEPGRPHKEENLLAGQPTESLFTYAYTKRMMFVGLAAIQKQFGLKYLFAIPSTLYGPGYHTDGRQMHFIFDLMRKIVNGKKNGEPVVLWGDGMQSRELMYVDDFVSALIQLSGKVDNEVINIGSGVEYTIRWYAEELCRLIGYRPEAIEYDTSRYVGARSKFLDVSRLNAILPSFAPTDIRTGLRAAVEWYLDNEERI